MTRPRLLAAAALAAAIGLTPTARAQTGFGQPGGSMGQPPGGGFGQPPGTGSRKKGVKPPPGQETHAASNEEATQSLQTQEPTLPQDPNAIPKEMQKRIGTDARPDLPTGLGTKTERDYYLPYYGEKSGNYQFRTLFPLWAERKMLNDRASLFGFYYNRRSKDVDADILFPLFWHTRDHETTTTVIGPLLHQETEATAKAPAGHANWLAPLVFEGKTADGSGYFHVPPLLAFTQHTSHDGLDVVGPMFCKWKGGPACDARTADKIDLGVAPFYFWGKDETSEYEVIPPLLHYYHYNELGDTTFNLWGPVLQERSPEAGVFDVFPFYFHSWGKDQTSTTLFPFYHHSTKGASSTTITPLFYSSTGEHGEDTLITWGYARYRGRTQLDMYSPFYWHYTDPDIGLDRKVLFPFYYSGTSPRIDDTVVFPFYGHFKRQNLSESTWITPLFRYEKNPSGWEADLFPLIFTGRHDASSHTVVAPFFWDFTSPHSRTTVGLPAFYRFEDDHGITQVALNTYYKERKVDGGLDWEFHFFPLFSYGQSPTGHFWNVLYGLAGYSQEGTAAKMRILYVPIQLN